MHVLWHIWGAEVWLHLLLTVGLVEIEWSTWYPSALSLGTEPLVLVA